MTLLNQKKEQIMPSLKKKPSTCSFEDCCRAFEEFVKLYEEESFDCIEITKGKNVSGNQYKVSYKDEDGNTKYFKPKLHRMWFYSTLEAIERAEDHSKYTVSHLCHNGKCSNRRHLVLESLAENKSRNTCPGANVCTHNPKCLRVGLQYDPNAEFVTINSRNETLVSKRHAL